MPVLTGTETTADFCAVRLLLEAIDRKLNIPAVRLAVWCVYAGLSTDDDLVADLLAARVYRPTSGCLTPLTAAEIEAIRVELFDRSHPEVDRHF